MNDYVVSPPPPRGTDIAEESEVDLLLYPQRAYSC